MKRKYLMISVAVLALGMGSTAYAGQWKTNAVGGIKRMMEVVR